MSARLSSSIFVLTMVLVVFVAPGFAALATGQPVRTAGDHTIEIPGWPDRPFNLHVPPVISSGMVLPAILVLHGGGADSKMALRLSCRDGDFASPKCLNALADRDGFVIVYPNGTSPRICDTFPTSQFCRLRSFNAGGGSGDYGCVSGRACQNNVDDIGYFRELLAQLATLIPLDRSRVYATGMSAGAAMVHRIACQMSDQIAAIAPVEGGNQYSTSQSCVVHHPMPVLEFHGSNSSWAYNGGFNSKVSGKLVSIPWSLDGWAQRNGCSNRLNQITPQLFPKRDANDPTSVAVYKYNCPFAGEIIHYFIQGGGHAWPDGWQFRPNDPTGVTTREVNANELILTFFKNHHL